MSPTNFNSLATGIFVDPRYKVGLGWDAEVYRNDHKQFWMEETWNHFDWTRFQDDEGIVGVVF